MAKIKAQQPKLTPSAVEAGGAAIGAATGLVVGGPVGAVAGAAAGPLAAFAARLLISLSQEFWRSLAADLDKNGVQPEYFIRTISANEKKRAAFLEIVNSVSRATVENNVRLLANAANRLHSADEREMAAFAEVAGIIASMTALQFEILQFIATEGRTKHLAGVSPEILLHRFQVEAPLIRHTVRTLELHGLIADEARLDRAIQSVLWRVTDFGDWLISSCAEQKCADGSHDAERGP